MKQNILQLTKFSVRSIAVIMLLIAGTHMLFSFAAKKITADFFQQLGILKTDADRNIINSILAGSIADFNSKKAKAILPGNRAAIVKDIFTYTKKQLSGAAFIKEYNQLRESNKPQMVTAKTPEQMQQEMIEAGRKSVKDIEVMIAKADALLKPMFEKTLAEVKKDLKAAEDPNNKQAAGYRKGYPEILKQNEATNKKRLQEWEAQYPVNPQLFIKFRLQQFMDETKEIDFNAELTEKNGKKYFVNRAYESKGTRWKMSFRSGKDVVETARTFVQQWINELN